MIEYMQSNNCILNKRVMLVIKIVKNFKIPEMNDIINKNFAMLKIFIDIKNLIVILGESGLNGANNKTVCYLLCFPPDR